MVVNGNGMLIVSKCWFAHEAEFISNWRNNVNSDGQAPSRHQMGS